MEGRPFTTEIVGRPQSLLRWVRRVASQRKRLVTRGPTGPFDLLFHLFPGRKRVFVARERPIFFLDLRATGMPCVADHGDFHMCLELGPLSQNPWLFG